MDRRPIIFSFFSGSGLLDLGFEKAGFDVQFVNEYWPSFLKAYQYSRQKMNLPKPKYGYHTTDINNYHDAQQTELVEYMADARKGNQLIGFIGGPPCPDFSVGGKNRGKEGENGRLSEVYVDLIIKLAPDFFLFENVKGLWRTRRHREFYESLKKKLTNASYCLTERLTNALEFGVPQDRDRILLFGVKKDILKGSHQDGYNLADFPWEKHIKYQLDEVKRINWPGTSDYVENSTIPMDDGIIKELTVQYWFDKNQVDSHPNAKAHFQPRNGISKFQVIDEGDTNKKSYKRLHRWRYSPTAAYGNNEVHLHPYKSRRLSASEALAIQSLPKEFELPQNMTLSDMFKTIGNGVPYMLSKGIADTIFEYLRDEAC